MAELSLQSLIDRLFTSQYGSGVGGSSSNIGTAMNMVLDRFYGSLEGNVSSTIQDFYGDFANKPTVSDKGYIKRTQQELDSIALGLQQAGKYLEPKKDKVRTQGDLFRRFQKTKQQREKARASLQVGELEAKSPNVVMVDPLTGQEFSTGVGIQYSPEQRLGIRNTNAWSEARNTIKGKVNAEQGILDTEAYSSGYENGLDMWDQTGVLLNSCSNSAYRKVGGVCRTREQSGNYYGSTSRAAVSKKAFNNFVGGNYSSLNFLQTYGGSQEWVDSVYTAMADTISSTYGNFYNSSYESMGQMITGAGALTQDVNAAQKTLTEQKFAASKQKKILDDSLRGLGKTFSKARTSMQGKSKQRKAKFKGFYNDGNNQGRPA